MIYICYISHSSVIMDSISGTRDVYQVVKQMVFDLKTRSRYDSGIYDVQVAVIIVKMLKS